MDILILYFETARDPTSLSHNRDECIPTYIYIKDRWLSSIVRDLACSPIFAICRCEDSRSRTILKLALALSLSLSMKQLYDFFKDQAVI